MFIVKDRQHPQFKRTGIDLHYTAKISLVEVSFIVGVIVALRMDLIHFEALLMDPSLQQSVNHATVD